MFEEQAGSRRVFTIEEANSMLPLVRAIATDLSSLAQELAERQRRLVALRSQRKARGSDVYSEELEQVERELAKDFERMKEYYEELTELGVEPKGASDGLVDFPAVLDGRLVYLCWKLGEAEVTHWHEIDAGFAGRQPLTAGSAASSADAGSDAEFGSL